VAKRTVGNTSSPPFYSSAVGKADSLLCGKVENNDDSEQQEEAIVSALLGELVDTVTETTGIRRLCADAFEGYLYLLKRILLFVQKIINKRLSFLEFITNF
jgi:hypothetical protein